MRSRCAIYRSGRGFIRAGGARKLAVIPWERFRAYLLPFALNPGFLTSIICVSMKNHLYSAFFLFALFALGFCPASVFASEQDARGQAYEPLILSASTPMQTWEKDGKKVFVTDEWAELRQGDLRVVAPRMVVWFDRKQSRASHVRAACVNVYAEGLGVTGQKPSEAVRFVQAGETRSAGSLFVKLRSKAGFRWECPTREKLPTRSSAFYKKADAVTKKSEEFVRETVPRGPELKPAPGIPQVLKANEQYVFPGEEQKSITTVYLGDVRVRYKNVRIRADRAVVWLDREKRSFEVYAHGDVRLKKVADAEGEEQATDNGTLRFTRLFEDLRADEVYINPDRERALATDAELRLKRQVGGVQDVFVFAGEKVYMLSSQSLFVRKGMATSCDFGRPHYALQADKYRVTQVDSSTFLTAWDSNLRLGESTYPFLPFIGMDLTGDAYLLTRLSVGSSSKFGFYTRTGWSLKHLGLGPEWVDNWDLMLDYYADRGPGIGSEADYNLDAVDANHRGDLRSYYVHDTGDKDATDLPVPKKDRGRFWWQHRTAWNQSWTTDLEFRWESDRGFLDEYFEDEFEREKRPESYLYTRYTQDSTWAGFLFKKRVNHWMTQVQEMPSAELEWIGLPFAGLVYEGGMQAGYYDLEPSDFSTLENAPGLGRAHTLHRLSKPFSVGFIRFDPSIELLGTSASKGAYADGSYDDSADRVGGGAGIYAGTDFFRSFDTSSEMLNINRLRHVVTPYVGGRTTDMFSGESADFVQMDRVDALDDTDRVEVGLRQRLQTKRGGPGHWETVDYMELDVAFVDQETDSVSPLNLEQRNFLTADRRLKRLEDYQDRQFVEVDFILRPADYFRVRSRNNRIDLEGDTDIYNIGTWWRLGRKAELSVDYDYITDVSSALSAEFFLELSDRWGLGLYEKYEFDSEVDHDRKDLETELHLLRQLHRWVFDIGVYSDEVNDDHGVMLGFRHELMSELVESEIEKDACKAAAKAGWLVYKFVSPQKRGVPDRIFFREGVTVLIEFKRPGGRTTRLQDMQIEKLKAAGIAVEHRRQSRERVRG